MILVMALLEKHYTPKQVAELLSLNEETIRRMFRNHPDVLKHTKGTRRGPRGYIKGHVTLRIPQSVLLKQMNEMASK